MKKNKSRDIPKFLKAFIQIGVLAIAVTLFSLANHYFIGFDPSYEQTEAKQQDAIDSRVITPIIIDSGISGSFYPEATSDKKSKKQSGDSAAAGQAISKKKSSGSDTGNAKKDKKAEIVKIDDKILADLLTPLEDGSTKVQLYAETLDSKLGPITYFHQSDYRWAKHKYGKSSPMYTSGCGPTIMAMIVNTFRPEKYITPKEMADFAYSKGCYVKGGGSTHDIVKKCATEYDIPVKAIRADEASIREALDNKKLLVALVGRGEFTTGGHFILITGIDKDGMLSIADSISLENTHKKWEASFIISQLKRAVSAGPLWEIG